jgi:ABC-type nitrate/sulfonate/bicarbonate transport system permease component
MIGIIVGEFITSQAGYVIMFASSADESAPLCRSVILATMGLGLYSCLLLVEGRPAVWRAVLVRGFCLMPLAVPSKCYPLR